MEEKVPVVDWVFVGFCLVATVCNGGWPAFAPAVMGFVLAAMVGVHFGFKRAPNQDGK